MLETGHGHTIENHPWGACWNSLEN